MQAHTKKYYNIDHIVTTTVPPSARQHLGARWPFPDTVIGLRYQPAVLLQGLLPPASQLAGAAARATLTICLSLIQSSRRVGMLTTHWASVLWAEGTVTVALVAPPEPSTPPSALPSHLMPAKLIQNGAANKLEFSSAQAPWLWTPTSWLGEACCPSHIAAIKCYPSSLDLTTTTGQNQTALSKTKHLVKSSGYSPFIKTPSQ